MQHSFWGAKQVKSSRGCVDRKRALLNEHAQIRFRRHDGMDATSFISSVPEGWLYIGPADAGIDSDSNLVEALPCIQKVRLQYPNTGVNRLYIGLIEVLFYSEVRCNKRRARPIQQACGAGLRSYRIPARERNVCM